MTWMSVDSRMCFLHTPDTTGDCLRETRHFAAKKIAFLEDLRFDAGVLPYATQCRWYEGSTVRAPRPQNQTGVTGHCTYQGTAPIFATTKYDTILLLERLSMLNPTTGLPHNVKASMCYRRLKVHVYRTRVVSPGSQIPYCGRCFAGLVLGQARCP